MNLVETVDHQHNDVVVDQSRYLQRLGHDNVPLEEGMSRTHRDSMDAPPVVAAVRNEDDGVVVGRTVQKQILGENRDDNSLAEEGGDTNVILKEDLREDLAHNNHNFQSHYHEGEYPRLVNTRPMMVDDDEQHVVRKTLDEREKSLADHAGCNILHLVGRMGILAEAVHTPAAEEAVDEQTLMLQLQLQQSHHLH